MCVGPKSVNNYGVIDEEKDAVCVDALGKSDSELQERGGKCVILFVCVCLCVYSSLAEHLAG